MTQIDKNFAEALADLIEQYLQDGIDADELISDLELKIMALQEDPDL